MNFDQIVQLVQAHPGSVLSVIWGSLGLSVGLETLLTKYSVQSKKLAFTLLHVISAVSGLATWYVSGSVSHAGGVYASLVIVAGFWHRFVVSDVNQKYVTPFLKWLSTQNVAATPAAAVTEPTVAQPEPPAPVPPVGA